jgi:hypothetical protein
VTGGRSRRALGSYSTARSNGLALPGDPPKLPALFDLEKDPAEGHNVAAENPEVVERLQKLAEALKAEFSKARPIPP